MPGDAWNDKRKHQTETDEGHVFPEKAQMRRVCPQIATGGGETEEGPLFMIRTFPI